MSLISWSIPSFPAATVEAPVETELFSSATDSFIVLSLIVCNWSNSSDAHIIVERRGSDDSMKFRWIVDLKAPDGPLGLDTKMVYTGGDKLVISSDNPDVSVDSSGSVV